MIGSIGSNTCPWVKALKPTSVQQYIARSYGSLTNCNLLFMEKIVATT